MFYVLTYLHIHNYRYFIPPAALQLPEQFQNREHNVSYPYAGYGGLA